MATKLPKVRLNIFSDIKTSKEFHADLEVFLNFEEHAKEEIIRRTISRFLSRERNEEWEKFIEDKTGYERATFESASRIVLFAVLIKMIRSALGKDKTDDQALRVLGEIGFTPESSEVLLEEFTRFQAAALPMNLFYELARIPLTYWHSESDLRISTSSENEYEKIRDFGKPFEGNSEIKKWKEQIGFFRRVRLDLYKNSTYRNKFVAIKDKRVVDHDSSKFRLAKRVNKRYPKQAVVIAKVSQREPTAEIPSPEFQYEI